MYFTYDVKYSFDCGVSSLYLIPGEPQAFRDYIREMQPSNQPTLLPNGLPTVVQVQLLNPHVGLNVEFPCTIKVKS